MDHFEYQNGVLCAEQVPIADIAAAVGTPFYCYSTATIERHYRVLADALAGIDATLCYSVWLIIVRRPHPWISSNGSNCATVCEI